MISDCLHFKFARIVSKIFSNFFMTLHLPVGSSLDNDEQRTNDEQELLNLNVAEEIANIAANNDVCSEDNPSVSTKEQLSVEEKEKDSAEEDDAEKTPPELVNFRIVWNKKSYDVEFDVNQTVDQLKEHIQTLTGLPVSMQKLMYKASTKEPICKQKMHKKVLDKGKPDDVIPGIKNRKESLPNVPLSGMYNKYGSKVRLTFKLELDQLWLGTKERTEKIPMGSIKNVVSEAIEGHEEYHILAIQLGPTEASRYWVYWVPAQYVNAIKDTILGKWQPF
ncbi:hypothetical protein QZH41_013999 [Actinostola sp. cb2023]|nr:hypothetical protein QZH41_013999 [Actinostola sp. cb2023]